MLEGALDSAAPSHVRFTHSISDLLDGLNVVAGNQLVICVEKLDTGFLDRALGKQKTFDTRKSCCT